ncbi:MAG: 50S ribosomal protein L22 [Alphaproteobacteria bacterium]
MGKKKYGRMVAENEAIARARYIRTSPQKLNLVAQMIRGKDVNAALNQLSFSNKKVAYDVRKVLEAAIANAENNKGLDIDNLFIAECSVGKAMVMKRWRPRARGRTGKIMKPWSNLRLVVREKEENA